MSLYDEKRHVNRVVNTNGIIIEKGAMTKYGKILYITWDQPEGYMAVIKAGDSCSIVPINSITKKDLKVKNIDKEVKLYGSEPTRRK